MIIFIGYLSLFLLTSDVSLFSKNSNSQWGNQFTDTYKRAIDLKKYCDNVMCIVKCCDTSQVLDDAGNCDSRSKYTPQEPLVRTMAKEQETYVEGHDFNIILAQDTSFTPHQYFPSVYKIYQDGSLRIKVMDSIEQWIEAPPLGFCMDSLGSMMDENQLYPFVFKLAREQPVKTQAFEQLMVVVLGMFGSLFFMLLLFFRIKPRIAKTLSPILIAVTITVVVGYTLKIMQLYALNTDSSLTAFLVANFSNCSTLSPAYYFFILSNCHWANVLFFDLWWRTRSFYKHRRDFHHRDGVRFILYCLYGWGVPMLMTLASIAVDITALDKIISIEKPPFESCFTNEKQTTLYLHVPVVIMTFINGVLFSMFIHQIVMLNRAICKSPHYKTTGSPQVVTTKQKIRICLKPIFGIAFICMLVMLPGLPSLPYIALICISVYFWIILFFTFVFNKSVFLKLTRRFKRYHHLSDKFQAEEFWKEVSKTTNAGPLFESLKNGDDTEKIINNNDIINV